MPKLLLFAACEQLIIDMNNTVSLLKLLHEITAQIPPGMTPPENTGSPMQWNVISIFEQEPSDNAKTFEHYISFVASSGIILFQSPISVFEMKAEEHRITTQVNGMPVGRAGKHHVKCFIREKGITPWTECGDYPVRIKWASSLTPIKH